MQKNERELENECAKVIKKKTIVCKFGGTSLANAENIRKVAHIIKSGKRQFVVVSAPGKRDKNDSKITDVLIKCFNLSKQGENFTLQFEKLKTRFFDICRHLSLNINLSIDFSTLKSEIESHKNYHFVISRGEFIIAKIISNFLNYSFLDARKFLTLSEEGEVDLTVSKMKFISLIHPDENYVIPGFYGESSKGEIITFSRGGSDVTGAVVAHLTEAALYENFTDVDGFFSANPQIVAVSKLKKRLTYDELRALSFFGANVLHPSCVQFLKKNNIVLNLKNTFNPKCSGTFILSNVYKKTKEIAGISGQKNFLILTIKKFDIQNSLTNIFKIENILKNNYIVPHTIHISLDQICIVLNKDFAESFFLEKLIIELKIETESESIEVKDNVAIVSVVGESIRNFKEVECRVLKVLCETKRKLTFVSKDSNNLFIQFAIDEKYFENMIKHLHKSLF